MTLLPVLSPLPVRLRQAVKDAGKELVLQPPPLDELSHQSRPVRQVHDHSRHEARSIFSEKLYEASAVETDKVNLNQLAMLPKELHERQEFGFSACIMSVKNLV